jgi:hypothetical protein
MRDIVITQEKMKELDAFIQEMPVKYGLPLIDFFNQIVREQTTEEQKPEGPR